MNQHQILNSADHLNLRVHTEAGSAYGDDVMACITVPLEFRQVQGRFPIVFRRDIETGKLSALALMGFENGENLFFGQGQDDGGYRPLALAIHPFLIGRRASEGGEAQVHIDMGHPRISINGEGIRVFDEEGRPTPYLDSIAEKLGDLDYGYRQSAGFFSTLEAYGLVEPFSFDVTLDDGSKQSLVGFQTINEDRVAALDAAALHHLHTEGHLLPIFMVLASLTQFAELVARKKARIAGG